MITLMVILAGCASSPDASAPPVTNLLVTAHDTSPIDGAANASTGAITSAAPEEQGGSNLPPASAESVSPTGIDQYLTDPTPEGKPQPVEPNQLKAEDDAFTVTFSVRCDVLLNNMGKLAANLRDEVPADGAIFPAQAVTVRQGETVFQVLRREMKNGKIHLEFSNVPIYNSAYIEGIHNLYEFDAGELSGWMYRVNGWFPNYGCSRYQLKPGDVVEWLYTCDLGADIGGADAAGGGQIMTEKEKGAADEAE
jgi:hypothetical protein